MESVLVGWGFATVVLQKKYVGVPFVNRALIFRPDGQFYIMINQGKGVELKEKWRGASFSPLNLYYQRLCLFSGRVNCPLLIFHNSHPQPGRPEVRGRSITNFWAPNTEPLISGPSATAAVTFELHALLVSCAIFNHFSNTDIHVYFTLHSPARDLWIGTKIQHTIRVFLKPLPLFVVDCKLNRLPIVFFHSERGTYLSTRV